VGPRKESKMIVSKDMYEKIKNDIMVEMDRISNEIEEVADKYKDLGEESIDEIRNKLLIKAAELNEDLDNLEVAVDTFWSKYKTPILIAAGALGLFIISLIIIL
jgi:uncharacterized protein YaaN involved in tellurite resistance